MASKHIARCSTVFAPRETQTAPRGAPHTPRGWARAAEHLEGLGCLPVAGGREAVPLPWGTGWWSPDDPAESALLTGQL